MAGPTNTDIMNALNVFKAEDKAWKKQITIEIHEIKQHAEYTNGKVAGLIDKDIRRDERERILAELEAKKPKTDQPTVQHADKVEVTVEQRKWNAIDKLVGGAVLVMGSIAAAIGVIVGSGK